MKTTQRKGRILPWLLALACVPLVAAASCSSRAPLDSTDLNIVHAQLDASVSVPVGHTIVLDGTALRITFRAVSSDSRCPMGVLCIWAGDAAVALRIDAGSGITDVEVHTTLDPHFATIAGYRVELLGLDPPKRQDGGPLNYVATLRVTRP